MAERITPKEKDFSQWYHDIVMHSKLADYSPVKGCMVIRPNGYALWEKIQSKLDPEFKKRGVQNAYFPLLIPMSFIEKEKEHVEGFSPELAVVTQAGGKELEEPYAIRPTSETIINSMFSKWIQSYRDLPLLINQWCNTMRWELRTRLFLRTSEFLWHEGHSCHADEVEARQWSLDMLEVYTDFAENEMAFPVFKGRKTDHERFAGAVDTYTFEVMMQDGKALQAGTSHYLGQNFSKSFETKFQSVEEKELYVHQTSWGVSTRLIGALVMTHSDDKGLVLPPRMAPTQVVMIPIDPTLKKNKNISESEVIQKVEKIAEDLRSKGISVKVDSDPIKSPGWKFHEYEIQGIPLRCEIGPRDLAKDSCMLARRDTGDKESVSLSDLEKVIFKRLEQIQDHLYRRAKEFRDARTVECDDWDEFKKRMESGGGFVYAHWCGDTEVEKKIKEETKATIRLIPFDEETKLKEPGKCVYSGKPSKGRVLFAKSY